MDLRASFALDRIAACEATPDRLDPRRYAARDKARDGTFVHVRAVGPDDAPAVEQIVADTGLDPRRQASLVATVWLDGSERIVGVGSLIVDPWSERPAEMAVTVRDTWQGRGIGSILAGHLARLARRGFEVEASFGEPDPRLAMVG